MRTAAESPRERQRRNSGPGAGPIIAVFLWALLLRLVYLAQIASNPFFDAPRQALSYTGPLYPYFIQLVSRIAGPGYFAPRLAQALLGSAVACLVYLVARQTYGSLAGLIAGFLAGASAMLIYFDGEILPVVFENFAILLFLWLALVAARRSRRFLWPLAGGALGLAISFRLELAFFGAASLGWAAWMIGLRPARIAFALGGLAIGAIVVLGIAGSADSLYPAGINYYFGNHAGADGVSATAPGFTPNPPGGYADAIPLAATALGRTVSAREADRYWFREGRDAVAENPARVRHLVRRRALAFWNSYEYGNHQLVPFFRRYAPLLRSPLPGFGFIAPLALAGLLFTVRTRERVLPVLFVISFAAVSAFILVSDRTRIAVVPVLLVPASGFLAWLIRAVPNEPRRALLAIVAGAVLFVVVRHDFTGVPHPGFAGSHMEVAERDLLAGRLEDAARELATVERLAPDYPGIHLKRADLLLRQGDLDQAAEEYRREIAVSGPDPELLSRLASLLQDVGRHEDAASYYRQSLRLRPKDVEALYGLARCQLEEGDLSAAEMTLQELLRLEPGNLPALNNLGVVAARQGRYDVAIATWRKVLAIDPDFQRARANIESATRGRR